MSLVNFQPTLSGERLALRPLRPDEFDVLFQCASDSLIWEQHPHRLRYQREVFQKFFDDAIQSRGALAIIEKGSGRVIGSSRYYNHKPDVREVAVGFTFLTREFWGGPYNAELKRLMLNHAFKFVDRVIFHVGEFNLRSQAALKKIGATFSGTEPATLPDGTRGTTFVFEIRRENYERSNH